MKIKGLAIGLILISLGLFIGSTQYAYYKETGIVQFTAFGSWQIAANALYGYSHAPLDSASKVPIGFKELHTLVNKHMRFIRRFPPFLRPDRDVGIYYLWDFDSPLLKYMNQHLQNDPYFVRWARMAPLYSAYGRYLIEKHPKSFLRYYIVPNLIKYYTPPTGFMGSYNLGKDTVDKAVTFWFGWKNNKVKNRFNDKRIMITNIFPIGMAIINLVFILCFLGFTYIGSFKTISNYAKKALLWVAIVWFTNMVFSIISAPIELRYQLFPLFITILFMPLLLKHIIQKTTEITTSSEIAKYRDETIGQDVQLI